MRLPQIGVRYPVTTVMIFIAVIVLGTFALSQLGLDMMPDIEIPAVSAITTYFGAGPEEIESQITEILEDQLSTVSSLDRIESSSEEGVSVITLKFDWGINMDEATNDVRDRIDLAKKFLPEDADDPVVFKFDPSMMPVLVMAVNARESYPKLKDLLEDEIADPLETVPGVAAVTIMGGLQREILVELDHGRMEAYHVSTDQITQVLKAENLSIPGGHLKAGQKDYLIRTPEEIEISEIGKIVVSTGPAGEPIYIKDIARVKDTFKEQTQLVEVDRKPGLMLILQKQSGANTVDVARRALRKLEGLKKNLPLDVNITVVRDFSEFIVMSLKNLRDALLWGGSLVVLILLLFLRNIRAGLIIAVSIPTSLIGAFLLLYLGGYTLNIISLSSLAIAMGMVVDAAIVVIDNIHRHRERGERPNEAAIYGTSEMGKAIIASTLTTVIIFVPIVFVGGIMGIMFKEMALVITSVLLMSLLCALILVPMLGSKFLGSIATGTGFLTNIYAKSELWFTWLDKKYENLLGWSLSNRKKVILGAIGILVISLAIQPLVGAKFMPEMDSNLFTASVELPVGTRVEETTKVMEDIQDIVMENVPERIVVSGRWGYGGESRMRMVSGDEGSNMGWVGCRLVPKENRKRSVFKIVKALRPLTKDFPAAKIRYSTEDPLHGMFLAMGKPFVLELYGHDMMIAQELADKIVKEMSKVNGIVDIEISRKIGKPELQIKVDRDKASALGLNVSTIGNVIQTLFSGKISTRYRERGKEYDINVRLKEEDRLRIDNLRNTSVTTPKGTKIRLNNIASIEEALGPVKIERKNQHRVIKITANLSGRALSSAVNEVQSRLKNLNLPGGFYLEFGGERQEQVEAFRLLTIALLLGVALVYMVMASQFESLRDPFIILFSIPFALIGVTWALLFTREVFTGDAFIGLIMLVGIVVNNAIVLISYINILRARGLNIRDAVTTGGRHRLRPVLMTTLTTICGMTPLALSTGTGSEGWRPFGITIIGGLTMSTLITLVLIPVIYSLFEEKRGQAPFSPKEKKVPVPFFHHTTK